MNDTFSSIFPDGSNTYHIHFYKPSLDVPQRKNSLLFLNIKFYLILHKNRRLQLMHMVILLVGELITNIVHKLLKTNDKEC